MYLGLLPDVKYSLENGCTHAQRAGVTVGAEFLGWQAETALCPPMLESGRFAGRDIVGGRDDSLDSGSSPE